MFNILVVDDEKNIVEIIKHNLEREGYKVSTAYDGEAALNSILTNQYDLILLDIMIPKKDGLQVCREVREFSNVPIIMITAKAEEVDKVLGLEFGADDYITKPFGVRELIARVKSNLRRVSMGESNKKNRIHNFDNLTINLDRYEVTKEDKVLELTSREYELLEFLALRNDQIFTREQLLEKVWGYEYYGDVRTVDVTVRRLREKIEDEPAKPTFILTKRGVGYYFRG